MIKRTLYFGNPAYLKKQQDQLVVDFKDEVRPSASVPIEDIGLVVLDHQQVSLTHGLANALISNNAALLFCDERHLPNGLVLPMSANSLFTEKLRAQLDASAPLKKQLWKQTAQAKIRNQAAVLTELGLPTDNMQRWAEQVGSGDPVNLEGRAAAWYWKNLFEHVDHFTRHRYGEPPNNMLNYGYAILRAVVARSLVGSGCLPAMGIHHRNKYNAFCLADDIMEPYRPYVDRLVLDMVHTMEDLPEELGKEEKARLLAVPTLDVHLDGMKSPLMVAMQRTTASLMACYEGESRTLAYPQM
ncbi:MULTISPECIES: type II CRISPR-associated endonuclease Cas1 [unclassified Imperialibacter]|uniref:type II CRISPR-associated endonuclease Cas1 n=1 Tax=unclassified Imperialibacter TaxID=2629706 RepID=UPI0012533EE2|nr:MULTISPECIES: type II CRISPR-associated endonuclease Cas1 [unclassified Imperialibacter]CAD5249032.1 CRISPR-associated endonuclease Cas1 [Imperialibacter sp. 89]CAD5263916.1 CRISPR-associated endonuclease Cas1 [Imperialibacter sp. 75]VVT07314.1 CRISPR-associated endonuclease Cas1 [Imperialibacter sp. EC-SDR9]